MMLIRNLHEKNLVSGWSEFSEYSYDYQRRDGRWIKQTREVLKRGPAVAVLPFDKQRGTVLLVRQFRMPAFVATQEGDMIEACAGVIDRQDQPEETALREAREELGYDIRLEEKVFEGFCSPGNSSEISYLYLAAYRQGDKINSGGGLEEEGEDIEIIEMAFDQAWDLMVKGSIRDMKTALLLWALSKKLEG